MENHFPELRLLVKEKGLFKRAEWVSVLSLLLACIAYIGCIALLSVNQSALFVVCDAVLLTIVSGQFGFLMHDAGHRQIFKRTWKNKLFGHIASFFNGTSLSGWTDQHNAHHENPNHEDLDPDIDVFFVAYSEAQVDNAGPVMQYLYRFQAWYATLLYAFVYYFMRYGSVLRLVREQKAGTIVLELSLMVVWHVLYIGTLYLLLGIPMMLLFIAVHHALTGLHLALAFAPNHKGMPIFEKDKELNWFEKQVVTARNIYSNPIVNFLYGGLNFQIEHHLFPTMPRIHLRKAHVLTKEFCKTKNVEYYETSVITSYKEVYGALAEVAHYAKNLRRPVAELKHQLSELLQELKESVDALKEHGDHPLTESVHRCIDALNVVRAEKQSQLLLQQKEVRELIAAVKRTLRLVRA